MGANMVVASIFYTLLPPEAKLMGCQIIKVAADEFSAIINILLVAYSLE